MEPPHLRGSGKMLQRHFWECSKNRKWRRMVSKHMDCAHISACKKVYRPFFENRASSYHIELIIPEVCGDPFASPFRFYPEKRLEIWTHASSKPKVDLELEYFMFYVCSRYSRYWMFFTLTHSYYFMQFSVLYHSIYNSIANFLIEADPVVSRGMQKQVEDPIYIKLSLNFQI